MSDENLFFYSVSVSVIFSSRKEVVIVFLVHSHQIDSSARVRIQRSPGWKYIARYNQEWETKSSERIK